MHISCRAAERASACGVMRGRRRWMTFRQPECQGRDKARAGHSSAEGHRPGAARLSPNS
jgi:hypothetical protein